VNCWSIAEHAGDATPGGMQHLLSRASWDADGVRDDLRRYVTGLLGDRGAVLVVDETGDVKKGTCTAGVARQDAGTAGRTENAQVAVCLSDAAPGGHALIDRDLYLPQSWISDPGRCRAAGIPPGTGSATKPGLARAMIARATGAGTPASWVAGDEVYGAGPGLRADLEVRQLGYVLAIARHRHIVTAAGAPRADTLAARLPPRAWQKLPAGAGAKGHRYCDRAWVAIEPGRAGHRHLLVRRGRRTRELACCRCYAPGPVPLARLARIAGLRWTAEEDFAAGKALAGLDEHQVRRRTSWYRRVTLAMLALALVTVAAAAEHTRDPQPAGQVPLTRNEIARLLTLAVPPASGTGYRLRWSAWRRRHQRKPGPATANGKPPTTHDAAPGGPA